MVLYRTFDWMVLCGTKNGYILQTLLSKAIYSAFRLYMFCQYVFPGNRTHNLCAANAMLYHWATGTLFFSDIIIGPRGTAGL